VYSEAYWIARKERLEFAEYRCETCGSEEGGDIERVLW